MHGQLTASSIPGQGSAFTIQPPARPGPRARPSTRPRASVTGGQTAHPAGVSISVLYIEDSSRRTLKSSCTDLRSRPNIRLRSERSGRADIEYATRDRPDIILLDLHLPDLHGDQVLSELKAEPGTTAIPVVVLSADASHGVIRRLLAAGALAYLTKPIELAELGQLLDTIAAARAQDRQAQPAIQVTPA